MGVALASSDIFDDNGICCPSKTREAGIPVHIQSTLRTSIKNKSLWETSSDASSKPSQLKCKASNICAQKFLYNDALHWPQCWQSLKAPAVNPTWEKMCYFWDVVIDFLYTLNKGTQYVWFPVCSPVVLSGGAYGQNFPVTGGLCAALFSIFLLTLKYF